MAKAKQENLDKIKQLIIDNKVCNELSEQATNLVFGKGNPDAEIFIIGEAPGKNEDLTGEPFVGAAGKFLNEMLDGIGFNRDDVYITNIVKYRPPENRDPLPEEKKEFLPYLHAQLEVIQPKVIVTLGRHSMNCFLPGMQISKIHGQTQIINAVKSPRLIEITGHKPDQVENKWVIMPLYHPAAALYNGGMRQTLIEDFTKLTQIVN